MAGCPSGQALRAHHPLLSPWLTAVSGMSQARGPVASLLHFGSRLRTIWKQHLVLQPLTVLPGGPHHVSNSSPTWSGSAAESASVLVKAAHTRLYPAEVNASPSLSTDTPADFKLKFDMVADALSLVDLEGKLDSNLPATYGGWARQLPKCAVCIESDTSSPNRSAAGLIWSGMLQGLSRCTQTCPPCWVAAFLTAEHLTITLESDPFPPRCCMYNYSEMSGKKVNNLISSSA